MNDFNLNEEPLNIESVKIIDLGFIPEMKQCCDDMNQRITILENIIIKICGGDVLAQGASIINQLELNRKELLKALLVIEKDPNKTLENEFLKVESDFDNDFSEKELPILPYTEATSDTFDNEFTEKSRRGSRRRPRKGDGKLQYACPKCGLQLANRTNLRNHLLRHRADENFKCDQCNETFRSEYKRNAHAKSHVQERPFKCDKCPLRFPYLSRLQYHSRRHDEVGSFVCEHCNKRFKMKRQLDRHLLIHSNLRRYSCPECGKKFYTGSHVKVHLEKVHQLSLAMGEKMKMDRRFAEEAKAARDAKPRKVRKPRKYTPGGKSAEKVVCHTCGMSIRKSAFSRHLKIHEPRYFCQYCDKGFSAEFTRDVHARLVHLTAQDAAKRKFFCKHPDCGAKFTTKSTLRHHEVTHLLEPQFFCVPCDKSYKHRGGLRFHNNLYHRDEVTKYVCSECPDVRAFSSMASLKRHTRNKHHNIIYITTETETSAGIDSLSPDTKTEYVETVDVITS